METHMQDLNVNLERIVNKQDTVQQRIHEAIANHIRLHTTYKSEFFIIDTEIRALEGENRKYILTLRDRYDAFLHRLLLQGLAQGILRPTALKLASYPT